jgi:hypothetical protein
VPNQQDCFLSWVSAARFAKSSDEKDERMMIEVMAEVGISQAMIFAFKAACRRAAGVERRR